MSSEPTSATRTRDYTVIVAVRRNGDETEFLLVRHPERGWELPGGKIEDKEGPVHCALREFREETGHLLSNPKFVMKLPKPNGTCFVFTGGMGERVGVADDAEVQEAQWFHRLPDEDLAFPDDPYEEMGQHIGLTFR